MGVEMFDTKMPRRTWLYRIRQDRGHGAAARLCMHAIYHYMIVRVHVHALNDPQYQTLNRFRERSVQKIRPSNGRQRHGKLEASHLAAVLVRLHLLVRVDNVSPRKDLGHKMFSFIARPWPGPALTL